MPSLVILVSAVLILSCGQTDRQTIAEADQRYTHATTVGVSNKQAVCGKRKEAAVSELSCI